MVPIWDLHGFRLPQNVCSEPLKISKQKFSCKYWGFRIRKFGCFDDVSKISILLTSSNNQISEFRIPNIYNEIFVLIFLMILRTNFEASFRFKKNQERFRDFNIYILLTSSNNQSYEFRIPNIYNLIFVLIFLMILRTHFEASLRFRKNQKRLRDFNL